MTNEIRDYSFMDVLFESRAVMGKLAALKEKLMTAVDMFKVRLSPL